MDKIKTMKRWAIPLALSALPVFTFATSHIPTRVPGGSAWTLVRIENLINAIADFLIVFGIIIAVIFIIWGGIKYMTARGDPKKADEAKGAIINGVIGAAVVLGVGVIIRTLAGVIAGSFFGAGI